MFLSLINKSIISAAGALFSTKAGIVDLGGADEDGTGGGGRCLLRVCVQDWGGEERASVAVKPPREDRRSASDPSATREESTRYFSLP